MTIDARYTAVPTSLAMLSLLGCADAHADPEFIELVPQARQQIAESVAFADLDDDGIDDIVLANRSNDGFRGGSVVILYGRRERLASSPFPLSSADAELVGPMHQTGGVFVGSSSVRLIYSDR